VPGAGADRHKRFAFPKARYFRCDRAQAVVLDQVFFSLDSDKFKKFTAMLDAPPGPNTGLERLLAVKAPWRTVAE